MRTLTHLFTESRRQNPANRVFIDRLEQLMQAQGHTNATLAKLLRVHPTLPLKWRQGYSSPSMSKLVRLAEALGTDPNYLLGFEARAQRGRAS